MTLLTEGPLRLGLICLAVVIVAVIVFLQTRKKWSGIALAVVVLLSLGLIIAERAIVTDTEAIHAVLFEAAVDVGNNDFDGLREHLAESADALRLLIDVLAQRTQFDSAKITDTPEIRFHPTFDPPAAAATFMTRAEVDFQGTPYSNVLQRVEVNLVRESDGWKIESAEPVGSAENPLERMR